MCKLRDYDTLRARSRFLKEKKTFEYAAPKNSFKLDSPHLTL